MTDTPFRGIDHDKSIQRIGLGVDLSDSIEELDSVLDNPPDNEAERITLIKQLFTLGAKSAWLVGELLLQQKKIIEERYDSWKDNRSPEDVYTQEKSISAWVDNRREQLGFGARQARKYIDLRLTTEREVADRLGTKKINILNQSKIDKDKREALKERAVGENWTAERLREEVEKNEYAAQKQEQKAALKRKYPRISVSRKKEKIVLQFEEEEDARLFDNYVIDMYIERLRESLFNIKNRGMQ